MSQDQNKFLHESLKNALREAEEQERIRAATEKELKTEKYKSFFEGYHPNSTETFIKEYARKKALYLTKGEAYTRIAEDKNLRYKTAAHKCLAEIQQKKLFNLQCRWRAEEIMLPGIVICNDFYYWEAIIHACPFLPPVSRDEMELYKKYLENEDVPDHYRSDSWQDYEKFKDEITDDDDDDDENETECALPGWYAYFDLYRGTDSLLSLPDVRGEKENFYRNMERKNYFDKVAADNGGKPFTGDPRPMASTYNRAIMEQFISAYEDRKMMEYFHAVEHIHDRFSDKQELDEAFKILRDAEHLISIKEGDDWRLSLKKAAKMYGQQMTAAVLPAVYDEYLFRVENNIPFEQDDLSLKQAEHALQMCELVKQQITGGRLLNGEKPDLDF